jgi:hypothetical protein
MKIHETTGKRTGWTVVHIIIPLIFLINCNNVFSNLPFVDNTPPSDPDLFTAASGNSRVALSWINPGEPDFSGIKIIRKTDTSPASHTESNALFTGTDNRYVDTDVANESVYYYTIFSYDTRNNYSAGVRVKGEPSLSADATAPGNVTSITRTSITSASYRFTWTNPGDSDFQGVKIMRSTQAFPSSASDGTEVYNSNGTTFTDSGLLVGTTYYYTLYTYDEVPNYSTGAHAAITTDENDLTSPGEVTGLRAEYNDTTGIIHFTWTNPVDIDFAGVLIVKKMNSKPDSNNDGYKIYSTTGYADDLPGDHHYYYKLYTFDINHNYSEGVNAAILYKTPCKIPYLNLGCCDGCK